MGLPWVRLDTGFASNPKVLALVEDKQFTAIAGYICGLAYAGLHGTDGFLPRHALPFLHAAGEDADRLTEVGLWHPGRGGWDINGWIEFQPTSEEYAARRKRAQDAAAARWRKAGQPVIVAAPKAPPRRTP